MAGQLKRLAGPTFIAAAAANILAAPGAGTYYTIQQIHIVSIGPASSFSCHLGLTGASAPGTQICGGTRAVAANEVINEFFSPGLVQDAASFLTGVAADASRLVVTVMGTHSASSS